MLLKHLNNSKGSATLETAIIFPVIFIIIIIVLFSFIKFHQIICIQSVINNISVIFSEYIINENIHLNTGYVEKSKIIKPNIYWRTIDLSLDKKSKTVQEYLLKNLKDKRLIYTKMHSINIQINRSIPGRKLKINVAGSGKIPKLLNNNISNNSSVYIEDKSELLIYNDIVNKLFNGDINDRE